MIFSVFPMFSLFHSFYFCLENLIGEEGEEREGEEEGEGAGRKRETER